MLEGIVHEEQLEKSQEQPNQHFPIISVNQPQLVATPSNQRAQSTQAASLRKLTKNQTIPAPENVKRQSKLPIIYGGG